MAGEEDVENYQLEPVEQIAERLGLEKDEIEPYGRYKGKLSLSILERLKDAPLGKYILVTAITPTPFGEGKTVTTIGLSMALNRLGAKSLCCIRQPSLGPIFGIKGGATGGGACQVLPADEINLHLTGDIHAVSAATNLLAAFIDNHIYHGNELDIDLDSITWRRAIDMNDRALRDVEIKIGKGLRRTTGFDITAASEVMAILALATSLPDLRERLGNITIGFSKEGKPISAEDLKCAGSMAALLHDAFKPNLLQTSENTPAIIHTGPFANIAHGNSSIIADLIGLRLAEYVVTESGFGADCGAEKFFNIKCRYSGLTADAVVLVVTVRALKAHSGKFTIKPGAQLPSALLDENVELLQEGAANMVKQIENIRIFGLPVVVAINRFPQDTDREISVVRELALEAGASYVCVSDMFNKGSEGGLELAEAVMKAAATPSQFKPLYDDNAPLKDKIYAIATKLYGAANVEYSELAEDKIALYEELGWGKLPICMAKTHLSLSHDPNLKGRPEGFTLPVRDVRPATGAGFIVALCGKMRTMPGLPEHPRGENIDIDIKTGKVRGI